MRLQRPFAAPVAETRKRLNDPAVKWDTFLAGRNLLILLEDEKLSAADTAQEFAVAVWELVDFVRRHAAMAEVIH